MDPRVRRGWRVLGYGLLALATVLLQCNKFKPPAPASGNANTQPPAPAPPNSKPPANTGFQLTRHSRESGNPF